MEKKNKLRYVIGSILLLAMLLFAGCSDDSYVASRNNAKASDNFEINRRVVFFNGITNDYLLEITGYCSINADTMDKQLEVICKVGDNQYKKHFLGLSDNVAYFVEQLEPNTASAYHYRVTFKPQEIIPDIDFRGSVTDGPQTQE